MSQAYRPTSFVLLSGLVALAIYSCYRLVAPFLPALTWALAFAVVGSPLHRFVNRHCRNPHLAAGISVSVVACILILPTWLTSDLLVRQASHTVTYWIEHEPWREIPFREHINLQDGLKELAGRIPGLLKDSVGAMTQLPIALFCLFFFFRDRVLLMEYLGSWLPLSRQEVEQLSSRISDILYATILGRLLLAAVQGALGGVMFWWLGLPTPLLWFLVMSVLALIPFLGTVLVWGPAALYLIWSGSVVKGIVLLAWGALVVSTIDNVLYPFLVGARMQLHPLVTFFGVLGGLAWFGASGIILGPVILAATSALLEVGRRRLPPTVVLNEPEGATEDDSDVATPSDSTAADAEHSGQLAAPSTAEPPGADEPAATER